MHAYLSTLGTDKVGFTSTGKDATASPPTSAACAAWSSATRCATTWRSTTTSPRRRAAQLDQRLNTWFDATERYARQLHEMSREDYLAMKHNEYKQQPKGQ